ncbi:MAG: hypothetical protein FWG63_02900 [Defluviitaleaceae bacterium]|nr:hypothetical protein [Defluviitaleaceae bacterium]
MKRLKRKISYKRTSKIISPILKQYGIVAVPIILLLFGYIALPRESWINLTVNTYADIEINGFSGNIHSQWYGIETNSAYIYNMSPVSFNINGKNYIVDSFGLQIVIDEKSPEFIEYITTGFSIYDFSFEYENRTSSSAIITGYVVDSSNIFINKRNVLSYYSMYSEITHRFEIFSRVQDIFTLQDFFREAIPYTLPIPRFPYILHIPQRSSINLSNALIFIEGRRLDKVGNFATIEVWVNDDILSDYPIPFNFFSSNFTIILIYFLMAQQTPSTERSAQTAIYFTPI